MPRMQKKILAGVVLGGALIVLLIVNGRPRAYGTEGVKAWHPASLSVTKLLFVDILNPRIDDPLHTWVYANPNAALKTHVRIRYQADEPIPILYSPYGAFDVDQAAAILPVTEEGDVLLPLTLSPQWRAGAMGFSLEIYGRKSKPPRIQDVSVVSRDGMLSRVIAHLLQPLRRQHFGISSANFLLGARIGGIGLPIVLGVSMIILLGILLYVRKMTLSRSFAIAALAVILLNQTLFLANYGIATAAEQWTFLTHGTYKQMNDLSRIVAFLHDEAKGNDPPEHIVICGEMQTALRYFVYPTPVEGMDEAWKTATHGVLFPPWYEDNGTISCRKETRHGTILQTFSGGGAVVRFDPPF